jgi:flagellar operon protein
MDYSKVHNYARMPVPSSTANTPRPEKQQDGSFATLLQNELKVPDVKISKHAAKRMEERNVHIKSADWEQMQVKLNEAAEKGVKESVVVFPEAALVVNAENRTIITAMSKQEAANHTFTNIDGVIFM